MNLKDLGYTEELENFRKEQKLDVFGVGRVISVHKEKYKIKTENGDFLAEMVGKLRLTFEKKSDLPAVGDWVAVTELTDNQALIQAIFPRKTIVERRAVGKFGEKQIIAANVDYALIVQAIDRDFSVNRIERYLTICNISDIKPIIIINKVDLINESELADILESIKKRIKDIPVVAISNENKFGYNDLIDFIEKGKTYCLLGSSGVGKSTLLNNLLGKELMKTGSIGSKNERGKHITSYRELVVLENGGIIIDNPGMREVGAIDGNEGFETTYDEIIRLSGNCKFNDCSHIQEEGCAVLEAVERGDINREFYENYLRMEREKEHFESTVVEKRKKDKDFTKMVKRFKKIKNSKKY
ncbi:ribosome small subunit-dependent GTPase A [Patescibacteria group bacterium]|nr:ribosome small subunit-dependent GTPase A [Patescibacteria group bacterium]